MEPNAWPQPREPLQFDKVEPKELLPIYPPPEPLELPELPSAPRRPSFDAPYTLTTHLFPACYLRTSRMAPLPSMPPPNATKDERKRILGEARLALDGLFASASTSKEGYPRVLWNCANRYVKNDLNATNKTGITLLFAHANGFTKEIFEPALGYLLNLPSASMIDEIWVWESVEHGDAGLINAPLASGVCDWADMSRDILNFVMHFLPPVASTERLPTHLQRVSTNETLGRTSGEILGRKLLGIGHSGGGCAMALCAITYPNLFKSIILIDPVIVNPSDPLYPQDLAAGALSRRDTWGSQEEALASFSKNPFFRSWDPAVLRIYVDCATYLTKDSSGNEILKLKLPGVQEAVNFAETRTAGEVFKLMPTLDKKVAIRWVMPGKPGAPELGGRGSQERVWLRPFNSTNTRILGGGHLIAQEAPQELAQDLNKYLLYLFSSPPPSGPRPNL